MTHDRDDEQSTRLAELEARVAELTDRLEEALAAGGRPTAPMAGSRRNLLKLAAGAAGGAALGVASGGGRAAAADGDSIAAGASTFQGDTGRTSTSLHYTNSESPQISTFVGAVPANIMTVLDNPLGFTPYDRRRSLYPAALGGYAYGTVTNGVYGFTDSDGAGVIAHGNAAASTGLVARGGRANVQLHPAFDPPPTRSDAHVVGEIIADSSGALWYCVTAGSPGTWRKLAGADTGGAFHAVTPFRVYDSRRAVSDGLAGGTDTTVSVKDARDVDTYAVVTADALPDGATAIAANIVAINAVGRGYATVNPGGDGSVGAAALNWIDGQTIGNAGIFAINATREVEVLVRGITNIDLSIDITGYWL